MVWAGGGIAAVVAVAARGFATWAHDRVVSLSHLTFVFHKTMLYSTANSLIKQETVWWLATLASRAY
jgi:hypothetical protein